jgi:hypothetical protein
VRPLPKYRDLRYFDTQFTLWFLADQMLMSKGGAQVKQPLGGPSRFITDKKEHYEDPQNNHGFRRNDDADGSSIRGTAGQNRL